MNLDHVFIAFHSIRHRKLRSWLTVIGIIIGVAAIISLITISRSLEGTIEQQFEEFGANRILISARGFQGPGTLSQGLTEEDVETVKKVQGFSYVVPALFRSSEVRYKKESGFTLVSSLPAEHYEKFYADSGIELQEGKMIREGDTYVTIIGSRAAEEMFSREVQVGSKITLNKVQFRVIGIVEEIGNAQDDNQIAVPLEAARGIFGEPERVDTIIAQVKSGENIPALQKKLERELERKRGDTNFQVLTATQILEQISQVLGVMQIVLIGIAAISLLVGAVGIMNSMYTSVLERTKDIGIMKAIGARNSDILQIFLMESGLIGLVGGVLGIALGTAGALLLGSFSRQAGFVLLVEIEPGVLLFGLLFALALGIISGILPAYQASKMKPVEALRYE